MSGTADRMDHTGFTRLYRAVSLLGEHTAVGRARAQVLSPAHGRLLILGLGPGHDLAHLPPTVTSVVSVEPSASMRAAAARRVAETETRGVRSEILDATGESLPLTAQSVDSVLCAYVLCSVASVPAVLAEVRRVLRPEGVVCVLEHVRARPGTWTDRVQRAASIGGAWPRLAGGCECRRDTRGELVSAGFDTSELKEVSLVNVPTVTWTLMGTARLGLESRS